VVENKPLSILTIAEDKKAILETAGYDSFPYSVFRYDPLPGQAYAEGPGCQVLPDVMVLNHLQEAIENAASQKAVPPLAIPARMFGRVLDRRPGALNTYNAAGLGLARADQAIIKLDFTGDIGAAIELKRSLIDDIEMGYFVDWTRPRETGDQTATEVNDKRDVRLRGMSPSSPTAPCRCASWPTGPWRSWPRNTSWRPAHGRSPGSTSIGNTPGRCRSSSWRATPRPCCSCSTPAPWCSRTRWRPRPSTSRKACA
jgi:hypothetical protein